MTSRRGFVAGALAAGGAALLGGCSINGVMPGSNLIDLGIVADVPTLQQDAAHVLEGGTLCCQLAGLASVDPHEARSFWERLVCRCVFDCLTAYDFDQSVLVGKAATSWEADAASQRFVFHLREGMSFHNGEALTSSCFAQGWNLLCARAGGRRLASCLSMVEGYEAACEGTGQLDLECPDDYTLIVNLSRSFPDFAYLAGLTQLCALAPSEAKDHRGFGPQPAGNGPFAFDPASSVGQGARLVRNDAYWGARPHVEAVEFDVLDDFGSGTGALVAGNLDVAFVAPDAAAQAVRDLGEAAPERVLNPGSQVALEGLDAVCMLVCNCARPPFSSLGLRRALSAAIDAQALAQAVGLDPLFAADSALVPSNLAYEPQEWESSAQAGETPPLAQAWEGREAADDEALEVLCDPCLLEGLGRLVVAQLAEAGVSAELLTPSWEEFADRVEDGSFDVVLLRHVPASDAAASELFCLFHSNGCDNVGGYADEQVDAELEQADRMPDEARRLEALREVACHVAADVPVVPLLFCGGAVACSARVNSLSVKADCTPDFAGCWLSS